MTIFQNTLSKPVPVCLWSILHH